MEQETSLSSAFQYFYYPDRPNLVINAILSGFHSRENNLVIRATFDFLINHIKIDSKMIETEERIRLVEGSLLTLVNRDFASHKKFFSWFLAHLDNYVDMDVEVPADDPAVVSCVQAYKRILHRYVNEFDSSKLTTSDSNEFNIRQPIAILIRVFQDDDMFDVRNLILKDITESLIKYIILFYESPHVSAKELGLFKRDTIPFFDLIREDQVSVWEALGELLQK